MGDSDPAIMEEPKKAKKAKPKKAKKAKPKKKVDAKEQMLGLVAGPDFTRMAEIQAQERQIPAEKIIPELYEAALRGSLSMPMRLDKDGETYGSVNFNGGHLWSLRVEDADEADFGPVKADVIVLGKHPGNEEEQDRVNFVGPSGQLLRQLVRALKFKNYKDWYLTNLIKFNPPNRDKKIISSWITDCRPLWLEELKVVQPKFILALGAEAAKEIAGGAITLKAAEGRVFEYHYYIDGPTPEAPPERRTALAMIVTHPASLLHSLESKPQIEAGFARFNLLTQGVRIDQEEKDIDHRVIDTWEALEATLQEADRDATQRVVAVDAEWHGKHPVNKGAYIRTIQISWKMKTAACIVIRRQGGGLVSEDWEPRVMARLLQFFKNKRVVGHYLNADLQWLCHFGCDIRAQFGVPLEKDGVPGWERSKRLGGNDTAFMCHAIEETANFDLTSLVIRYTTAPIYDVALKEWKKAYCAQHKLKAEELEGYGDCDDATLYYYASYDADVAYRLFWKFNELLDKDYDGKSCRKANWLTGYAAPAGLEITRNGIAVDRDRMDAITQMFMTARASIEQSIKLEANWPDFNIRSVQHVREYLYGEANNGRKKVGGLPDRIRPPGAKSLRLTPLFTTDKRPIEWSVVMANPDEYDDANPSTNKETLSILYHEIPAPKVAQKVKRVRDLRFIDHVLKSVLKPPALTADGHPARNARGNYIYFGGIGNVICRDGRVRPAIYPTKDTGRWSAARPNLMAISKSRDDDYRDILGKDPAGEYIYKHAVRSMFCASPGHLLIEADYGGAELLGVAMLAGDDVLLDHMLRNKLDESDPRYIDVHSRLAVKAFKLKCPPTKKGLQDIGRPALRNAAKCVVGSSRLHTSRGLLRVQDLVEPKAADKAQRWKGEETLLASHGKNTPLLATYNGGEKPCYRVETSFGYQLDASQEHKFLVMQEDGNLGFARTDELKPGDWVVVRHGVGPFGNDVTFPRVEVPRRTSYKHLVFPRKFNKDWASFLGLYLSEGSYSPDGMSITLACEDCPELAIAAESMLRRVFRERLTAVDVLHDDYQDQRKFSVSSVQLGAWLGRHARGNSHTWCVPEFVFRWPQKLVATFLRWLFEGDGSIKKNGRGHAIKYDTASEQLARDVMLLLYQFGIVSSLSHERREGYDGRYWTVRLCGNVSRARFASMIGFVTSADRRTAMRHAAYERDSAEVPYQLGHLRRLLPYVPSPRKEKCRECLRQRSRVRLSPTRLAQILDAVQVNRLDCEARRSYTHLRGLQRRPVSFQQVETVTPLGLLPVFDVETTGVEDHVVSYNGVLTHQSVAFGTLYGRQAKAIARACREKGTIVTEAEVERLLRGFFREYNKLEKYLAYCRQQMRETGRLVGIHGRARRFPRTNDESQLRDYERVAMNFPVQNLVADTCQWAIGHLYRYRREVNLHYRILLQIHDAILIEAPYNEVEESKKALHVCMEDRVPLYPTDLEGRRLGTGPYHMGIDVHVYKHWGEDLEDEELEQFIGKKKLLLPEST